MIDSHKKFIEILFFVKMMMYYVHVMPVEQKSDTSSFEQRAIATLRSKGLRITGPRVSVLRVLGASKTPLDAYTIQKKIVEDGGVIDVVSVYRIVDTLTENKLAHTVGAVKGVIACHNPNCDGNHPMIINEDNEAVSFPLHSEVLNLIRQQVSDKNFDLKSVRIEVLANSK